MVPLRILVVDDCRDNADTLLALLRLWGYEGIAAYDGANALDLARRHRPDVALLDVAMPCVPLRVVCSWGAPSPAAMASLIA
jgi:CheY-like chemotaxis protein